jgi:hypothetical protein
VKRKIPTIEFDEALVTDGVAWALWGMAQQESLLYTAHGAGFEGRLPSPTARQAALSLLILFDRLVVHDFTPGSGKFRIPDLERDGVLEIVAADEPRTKVRPLRSSWKPSKADPRFGPPATMRRSLALIRAYEPLIIDRLLSARIEFHDYLARTLGISRRVYYGEFLDLAINYALGNRDALRNNIIEEALPRKLGNDIKRELFDFQKHGEELSPTNAVLVAAMVFADELATIQELSATRGLGVATRYYTRFSRTSNEVTNSFSIDPSRVPKSFGLVRSILHEEGHFFPEVQNIAHALKLRKNPHLRAFRAQFREFHVQLARGDHDSLERVRKEVTRAKRALERTAKWSRPMRWLTYISLPAGLAESLLGGAPILGTSLAVLSIAGSTINTRVSRRNEWVLFGV